MILFLWANIQRFAQLGGVKLSNRWHRFIINVWTCSFFLFFITKKNLIANAYTHASNSINICEILELDDQNRIQSALKYVCTWYQWERWLRSPLAKNVRQDEEANEQNPFSFYDEYYCYYYMWKFDEFDCHCVCAIRASDKMLECIDMHFVRYLWKRERC